MTSLTNANTLRQLRQAVQTSDSGGKANTIAERFHHLKNLVEIGGVHTLEPLLPLCLSLNGKPYELSDHFAFSPFYKTRMPSQMVVVSGRQVSKSTTLAAHGVVLSNSIPFFRTLFITPLYEQIRRFSNNYVSSFINQSPVKSLWTGTTTKNSVLSKTFRNNSSMTFSFTGTDCDRVRGVSTDNICIDESYRVGTMVSSPDGDRPIETLQPGDRVYAFDENGYGCTDTVLTCSDHGVRDCYHIELANGASVEATTDSFIATTSGWRRVSTVITDWCSDTTAAGDNAGRREYVNDKQEPEIHQSSRIQAARVQLGEVPGLIRVRTHSSQESEESRLRRMVESVGHAKCPSSTAYRVLVPARREEAGNTEVVGSADLGGGRLVVPRRRQSGRQERDIPYSRIFSGGGFPPGFLADAEWYSRKGNPTEKPSQCGPDVLGNSTGRGCDVRTRREDQTVYRSDDAVQNSNSGPGRCSCLCCVPAGVPCTSKSRSQVRCDCGGNLPLKSLQAEASQRGLREELHTGAARALESETQGEISRGWRSHESQICRDSKAVQDAESGSCGCQQEKASGQKAGRAAEDDLGMSAVPAHGAARGERREAQVLPAMSENCDKGDQRSESLPLGSSEIVSITWTGKHRVFDISTAKHRTFFAGGVAVHNCQDFDSDHFPIIRETMSYSKWSLMKFTGTPKTLDNTLHGLWKRSSQAEWMIPCSHCKEWNIPSLEFHLEDMLGPLRTDISEEFPGTVCHKCRKPIRPREGHWVHRYKERRWDFAGYHVPQVIMPLHYSSYKKWDELLAKQRGWGNYTQARFYNEVLGESVDAGQQLVSETELKRAASLPWKNNPNQPDQNVTARLQYYTTRVLAVDWGGGGEAGVSFTTMALLGFAPDGKIHCLWGKRLVASQEHLREAKELLHWTSVFAPDVVVHDYTGAGVVREAVLVQAGFNLDRIMPIEYVRAGIGNMLRYIEPSVLHNRGRYRLDKTRSLLWTCQAIKLGMLQFFEYDYVNDDNPGLMHDFLALVEEKTESRMAGDIYTIVRNQMLSDDFAQAVNIGCCALWHINQAWPNFAQAAALGQISLAGLQAYDGDSTEWDDRRGTSGILATP